MRPLFHKYPPCDLRDNADQVLLQHPICSCPTFLLFRVLVPVAHALSSMVNISSLLLSLSPYSSPACPASWRLRWMGVPNIHMLLLHVSPIVHTSKRQTPDTALHLGVAAVLHPFAACIRHPSGAAPHACFL
jgi:hypothetical protein